eukprot:1157310-Pelagomonas_calceolata.AAC.1
MWSFGAETAGTPGPGKELPLAGCAGLATYLAMGTLTSSGSKNRERVHSLMRPGSSVTACQFPLTVRGHL